MDNHILTSIYLNTSSAANDATFQQDSDDGFVCLTMRLYEMSILPLDEVSLVRLKKKFPKAFKD